MSASTPTENGAKPPSPPSESKKLELTLSSRDLEELPLALIKQHSANIVKLDLSDNKLKSVITLPSLPRLHTLLLDKNRLTDLHHFPPFPSLTTLWLNNNRLSDLTALLDVLTSSCPDLTYLSMLRNPACPDMYFSENEAESYQRYRYYIIWRLKKLQLLDSTPVTTAERKEAQIKGPFCIIARPAEEQQEKNHQDSSQSSSSSASASSASSSASNGVHPADDDHGSTASAVTGAAAGAGQPIRVATFLAKGKPRYDGTNSEGNRFIVNEDL